MRVEISDGFSLLHVLRETSALNHLHRLLVAAKRQAKHPDLDEVDTPNLEDALAEVTMALEERDIAVRRYEGCGLDDAAPPRNRHGARL